jgi:hypothetical protein
MVVIYIFALILYVFINVVVGHLIKEYKFFF